MQRDVDEEALAVGGGGVAGSSLGAHTAEEFGHFAHLQRAAAQVHQLARITVGLGAHQQAQRQQRGQPVQRLRAQYKKPIVVSMASVAASGGYFMSAHADRILVLENGSIVESGRHDELLRKGGRYAAFYRLQIKEQEPIPTIPVAS